MDVHRRKLAEGPIGNAAHPHPYAAPSSAMKKGPLRASRTSMIPQAASGRASVAPVAGPSNAPYSLAASTTSDMMGAARRSTMAHGAMPRATESGGRADGGMYGRMSRQAPGSVRRSSVMGPRQSIAPSAFGSQPMRDSRPVRDKAFQAACASNITEFLQTHRYPYPLNGKTLTSPTQREFQSLVRFLVGDMIDPGFQWNRKFEDDCIQALRDLKYPAMEGVGKTALVAPGSPQTWPTLLAMLNWLVELIKSHDVWDDHVVSDVLLIPPNELPLETPNLEDRLLWLYTSKAYERWYHEAAEDLSDVQSELIEVFDRLGAASIEESEQLEAQINKRDVELRQLEAQEPPLRKLEEEYVQLMSDKTKFIAFNEMLHGKGEKLSQGIAKAEAALAERARQLDAARAELAQTEAAVAAQNLSPDEVQRMNHERETLTRTLDELRTKVAEATQLAYDQEMQVTKSMDKFEQLLQDYTALGHQIGTIVPSAEALGAAGPGGVHYAIEVELGAEDVAEVQAAGRATMQAILPALQAYGEEVRGQVRELQDAMIALEDQNDQLGQRVERQKDEVANLEMRLKVVHDQAEEAKAQLQAETAETNRTVSKLETEVTAMSTASQQGVLHVLSQLESTKIEFKELRHKTALLQDSLVAQLMSHIDVVIKAKQQASDNLKSVRTFAEAQ